MLRQQGARKRPRRGSARRKPWKSRGSHHQVPPAGNGILHNAHGLRDLAGLYRFDPDGQVWARSMADLLIDANATATAARSAGQASLSDADLARIRSWYRGAVAKGVADNQHKRTSAPRWPKLFCGRFHSMVSEWVLLGSELIGRASSRNATSDITAGAMLPIRRGLKTSGAHHRLIAGKPRVKSAPATTQMPIPESAPRQAPAPSGHFSVIGVVISPVLVMNKLEDYLKVQI